MSDAAEFALPLSASNPQYSAHAQPFEAEYPTQSINDAHAFPYSTRRWLSGARRASLSLVSLSVGAALLLQITRTPALAVQVAMLGTLLTLGGLVWGVQSIQDFLGQLVIDGRGIHQLPAFVGFSIPWEDLQRWEVRDDVPDSLAIPSIRFWCPQQPTSLSVANSRLSEEDRQAIRRLLQLRAPHRELHTSHA